MDIWVLMDDRIGLVAAFTSELDAYKAVVVMHLDGCRVEHRTDYDGSGGYGTQAVDIWNVSK